MKRLYYSLLLLPGIILSSCQNGSFIDPVITAPPNHLWYTEEPVRDIKGYIRLHDDQHGGLIPLPASKIIVAWELPNVPAKSLYIYGSGTYTNLGNNYYSFTVHLRDTLPDFALVGMDTANALAAGHLLITSDLSISDGDTLRHDLNWNNYHILGGMNNIGIVFAKGMPTLASRKLTAANSLPGFNLFTARKVDPNQIVMDFGPTDPLDVAIEIDDDGDNCMTKTAFWLP